MSSLPPYVVWLFVGFLCLLIGMAVGEPVAASLGVAALITAIAALSVPSIPVQVVLWGILSIALAVVLRGMVPQASKDLQPSVQATVSEPILPGEAGLVSYEGVLWKARCQISDISIASGQIVHVVGRQGLTLIVLPTTFAEELSDHPRSL
ncbi:MAG TPA: NfeD family protein [Trichocoleus sp.]|jgi:membrane protein implicated in regulation of membrane protease activity